MDKGTINVFVLLVAATAVGSILAAKYNGSGAWGGRRPREAGFVNVPQALPANSAPLAQNQPITEAAYNVSQQGYYPAFGPLENMNVADQQPILSV